MQRNEGRQMSDFPLKDISRKLPKNTTINYIHTLSSLRPEMITLHPALMHHLMKQTISEKYHCNWFRIHESKGPECWRHKIWSLSRNLPSCGTFDIWLMIANCFWNLSLEIQADNYMSNIFDFSVSALSADFQRCWLWKRVIQYTNREGMPNKISYFSYGVLGSLTFVFCVKRFSMADLSAA